VPYRVVLQRFGRETLLQEALDDLGEDVVREAIESEELEPYDAGEVEDIQLDPLILKLRLPLRPTVELGDYREIRIDQPTVEVDEARIDDELESLRQANAILEPADERPAKFGDSVSVDVQAHLDDEELVQESAYQMVLDPEDQNFERGFSEQIAGMKVEEEKQFTLVLGNAWGEEQSGKDASFSVKLREVRTRTLPGLDDDLARTVGDFDTLEALRQDIAERLEQEAQAEIDREYAQDAVETLVAGAKIEYPPQLVDDQIDDMTEDLETRLKGQGLELDDFYKLTGQTEEAYRESLRPEAETIVRRGLALGELTRLEELDVEGTEIQERIASLSASWGERAGEVRDMLSQPDSLRSIANTLMTDKAVQRLVAIAKGEAPPLEDSAEETTEQEEAIETASETDEEKLAEAVIESTEAEEQDRAADTGVVDAVDEEQDEASDGEMVDAPAASTTKTS
jgi:trigger factor